MPRVRLLQIAIVLAALVNSVLFRYDPTSAPNKAISNTDRSFIAVLGEDAANPNVTSVSAEAIDYPPKAVTETPQYFSSRDPDRGVRDHISTASDVTQSNGLVAPSVGSWPDLPVSTTQNTKSPTALSVSIAAGGFHTCALNAAGGVRCWGNNDDGQLGDGTAIDRLTPVDVVSLTSGITSIAAGGYHTCALTIAGGVKCWGRNDSGQLGNATTTDSLTPVDVNGLTSGVIAISAGHFHTCARLSGGSIKCWGNNSYGQLGDGTKANRLTPVDVNGLSSGVVLIVAGEWHTCALASGGSAKCWGNNGSGRLGDGTTIDRLTPVSVSGLASGVMAISAGYSHTCAVTNTGGAKCWGLNYSGQLGDGTTTDRLTPVSAAGLSNGLSFITAGGSHTCALTSAGREICWGDNSSGQLGDGTTINRITPTEVSSLLGSVVATVAGAEHTCALTASNGVKCWGGNRHGQLGNDFLAYRVAPVDVAGLVSGVTRLTAGRLHTCAATSLDGAKCWGWNNEGQLGDGTTTSRLTPVGIVGLTGGVAAFAAGSSHTCALATSGAVKCWGANGAGQLGDGTTTSRLIPVSVSGLNTGVIALTAGSGHTCALTSSGGVKCWGRNDYGQLGDGTTMNRLTPVDVSGLTSGVVEISAGYAHTCAVMSAGGIKCWGLNWFGQLGDGTTTSHYIPMDVVGLADSAIAVTALNNHATCALMIGGRVQCWGLNVYGQLGDGTTTDRLTPVNVSGLSAGIIAIAGGESHACALTSGGGVKCWGFNKYGQLGVGTTTDQLTPAAVIGLTSGVTAIAPGGFHTCALTNVGSVKCWGFNWEGELGNGIPAYSSTPVDVVGLNDDLYQAIDYLYTISSDRLDELGSASRGVADDGDYFRSAIGSDFAQLAFDVVLGFTGLAKDVSSATQDAVQLALPGIRTAGWSSLLNPLEGYDEAGYLFNAYIQNALQSGNWSGIPNLILQGGLKYYAAQFRDELAIELTKEGVQAAWHEIITHVDGLTAIASPALISETQMLTNGLTRQRLATIGAIPPIAYPILVDAYVDDLYKRAGASNTYINVLNRQATLLNGVRRAHEIKPLGGEALQFILKFVARTTAAAAFDGPGLYLVDLYDTSFSTATDLAKLGEDQRMYQNAAAWFSGASQVGTKIYSNATRGMNQLSKGAVPNTVDGTIGSISNFSVRCCLGIFEVASYSDVQVSNRSAPGAAPATFEVFTEYSYYGGVFGLTYMPIVVENIIQLAPGESGTVRIFYKDQALGGSPVPGTFVNFEVLGTNEAGTFYVGHAGTQWNSPTPVYVTSSSAKESMRYLSMLSNTPVVENPISTYVLGNQDTLTYEAQIWVTNPFTQNITTVVTQPITSGIQVISNTGTFSDTTITWSQVITPGQSLPLTFTFRFSGEPGSIATLPAAALQLSLPPTGQLVTTASYPVTFTAFLPVKSEGLWPGPIRSNTISTVPFTVTNLLSDASSPGTIQLQLAEVGRSTVYSQSYSFELAPSAVAAISFTLPVTIPVGRYLAIATLNYGSGKHIVYSELTYKGASQPRVRMRSEPSGWVYPDSTIHYSIQLTNTNGLTLTNLVMSSTIPLDSSLISNTISNGGSGTPTQVQWNIGALSPNEVITRAFSVKVHSNVLTGIDFKLLESDAWLQSDQTYAMLEDTAWNLVIHRRLYLPIVLRNN
jgi:uncharacterized repeat protein (TIGR01451 family)